jgi:hypothetical protein
MQDKKTKVLEPIPNFSIGLTPLEEEEQMNKNQAPQKKQQHKRGKRGQGIKISEETSDDNDADMSGKQKKVQIKGSTSHGKKKQQKLDHKSRGKKKEQSDASSDDEDTKTGLDVDHRLRHKLSIPKVYDLMKSINGKKRKDDIIKLLNDSGFGGFTHICKWTKIHTFFVEWVVKNF